MFTKIDMNTWERREHFQYYRETLKCGYSLTASIDVTDFLKKIREKNLKFYPSFVYCVGNVINHTKEFKMGLDEEGNPGYWDVVHPNYTVFHKDDHTFSDMWSCYREDFNEFYQEMVRDMENYGNRKWIKAREGQPPDFFCISCVPWLSYTGYNTYCAGSEPSLIPVITFGKYEEENGRWKMPLTVTISHAAADGYHTAKLIQDIQKKINEISF